MSGRTPNSSIRKAIDVNVQTIRQATGSEALTLPSRPRTLELEDY